MQQLILILFCITLLVIAMVDIKTMEIPDWFHGVLLVLGILSSRTNLFEGILGVISVSLPLLLLSHVAPTSFGGGDMKLFAAVGLFLGWRLSYVAFLMAVVLGGIYGGFRVARGEKKCFPFAPFICAGVMMALCWGDAMIHWYMNLWI